MRKSGIVTRVIIVALVLISAIVVDCICAGRKAIDNAYNNAITLIKNEYYYDDFYEYEEAEEYFNEHSDW